MYNVHPYFEACFQKKKCVSTSFLTKTDFLEKFSRNVKSSSTCTNISYRSWCKSFNVLSVHWYIGFYDVFFIFFWCFAAARSNVIHFHNACNIFYEWGVLELDLLATWQDSRWRCEEYLHNLFSFKSFCICSKNQKISEWIILLQSLKEDSSWNLLCHWNTWEIVTDFQSWL